MKTGLKIGAGALAGALTMGALLAPAALGQDEPSSDGTAVEAPFHERRAERRALRQAAMAAELGIDVETYRAAVDSARSTVRDELGPLPEEPTAEDVEARRHAVGSALAEELGIDVETLEQAARNVISARIDEGVATGRLGEERAAELQQALQDGTLRDQIRDRWHARRGG